MRTLILATAAALSLSAGVAYAGDSDGATANTLFTSIPGVVAQAQVPQASAVAQGQVSGAPTAAFMTNSNQGTWLFPPNPNQGANS